MINEKVLNQLIKAVKSKSPRQAEKKVNFYSRPALIILRYLDLTKSPYSRSGAAAELIEEEVKKEYPDLWQRVISEGVPVTKFSESCWPKKFPKIDEAIWKQAIEETETREGRIITIYHPAVSAVLRYMVKTKPRFNLSRETARLLERALEKRYPEVWEKALEASEKPKPRKLTPEEDAVRAYKGAVLE